MPIARPGARTDKFSYTMSRLLALGIRERTQQQLIDDREDGGVGADPQREREDDGNA